ncbi:MAG: translocation/assembly module TamB [Prevotellaceae bacterium]|nr:translocation/assembly module TamB [Prevotellaceae bacterium]
MLNDVYVQGLSGDTLIFVGRAMGSLTNLHLSNRYAEIGTLRLSNARLHLEKDTAGVLNLGSLLDRLKDSADNPPPQDSGNGSFHFRVHNVEADNLFFSYIDHIRQAPASDSAIDFRHVIVKDISFRISDLSMEGDTMQCQLEYLQLRERSGFNLHCLSGAVSVAPTFIEIKKLTIRDDFSNINASYYRMDYERFADFTGYVEKVAMSAEFTSSDVDLYTIAFFAPKMSKLHLKVGLTGLVNGTVSSLKGRDLTVGFGKRTEAKVSFSMQGLPDPQNTFFMFDVKNLVSIPEDISTADTALNGKYAKHEALLHQLGRVQGKARFTGFLSNFVADGVLRSDIGTLIGDLSFVPAPDSAILVNGTLGTDNFHLGKLLNDSVVGEIDFYGKVNGTLKSFKHLSLNADLNIPMVELYGYPYHGTKFRGLITEKSFRGELLCDDANMSFGFSGIANFEQERSQFDFKLQVHHADFAATGINRRDSLSQLTLEATAKLEGNSIDNFSGKLTINSAKYTSVKGEFSADSILLEAKHIGDTELLTLKSDVLEASLNAKGGMMNMSPALDSMFRYFIPAYHHLLQVASPDSAALLPSKASIQPRKLEYSFSLLTKNAEKLQLLLTPGFMVADSTLVSGCISSDISCVKLKINAPYVRYGGLNVADVRVSSAAQDSLLNFIINARQASLDNLKLQDLEMAGTLQNNLLSLASGYKTSIASGRVKTQVRFFENSRGKKGMDVELFPSTLALSDMRWKLFPSKIRIEDRRYTIDGFKLENELQRLHINGAISTSTSDTLLCELHNLSVAQLIRPLNSKVELTGNVSGSIVARGLLAPMPLLSADVNASAVTLAHKPVGDITLHTSIAENEKDVTVKLSINKDGEENLSAVGTLTADGEMLATAKLNKVDLYHVEPLVEGALSDIGGTLSGELSATGRLRQLLLNGELYLSRGQLKVDYLNTTFKVSGPVAMENNTLQMRDITVTDEANNPGKLSFTLANITTPEKLHYSLTVAPNKFHVFNTTERHNDYFYGQGYATGTVQINGKRGETSIEGTATTNDKTAFSILLGSKGQAQAQNRSFIDFVSHDEVEVTKKKREEKEASVKPNIKVSLNLNATNDANLTLVLNQHTDNAIKASGSGNIKLEVEPAKNIFRLFGSYVMHRGEYSISIQNLVNKKFKIDNGSTISFNGEMAASTANVHASYKVRAPLSDLFSDTTGRYERAIPIECKVNLTGSLTAPELKFSIEAPTADNETKDRMLAQLNTEDNMTIQFLSLLLIDRFMPQQDISDYGQIGSATLGGLLFSQVSDLVSRFMNASVGVTVDPSDREDWGLSFNKDITDRITLNANVEHQSQRKLVNPNNSEYSRDVDLEVTLDKSGRVRVKAFNYSNDQYTEMVAGNSRYGLGIVYQEDFDSFEDLWRAIFSSRKSKKKSNAADEKEL